jgi:hypothetical protein
VVRAACALYERLNPSYFIHPALYYELLAGVFGVRRVALFASGGGGAIEFADRFLTHQAEFLDMARYVSLASGALAVAAAVWLGTVLSGVSAGVLAGLVVASLPVLQELATSIRVDALGLATLLGAAALVVRWHDRPSRHSLFVAGRHASPPRQLSRRCCCHPAVVRMGAQRDSQFRAACARVSQSGRARAGGVSAAQPLRHPRPAAVSALVLLPGAGAAAQTSARRRAERRPLPHPARTTG